MIKKVIDLIYPPTCAFCGTKISERYTCRKCLNIIEYYGDKVLFDSNFYFDKLICAFEYKNIMKMKMLQLKFNENKYISRSFGEILSLKYKKYHLNSDIIVPVPISRKRYFERGYNQSEYIARYMSKCIDVKNKNELKKVKQNKTQSNLKIKERYENVKGVYKARNKNELLNKSVVIVDDIYTTGATINECSKILKENGAREVIAMTVLYSPKYI